LKKQPFAVLLLLKTEKLTEFTGRHDQFSLQHCCMILPCQVSIRAVSEWFND
jgi:hypothetical protein